MVISPVGYSPILQSSVVDLSVGWLIGRSVGRSVGWLAGWLAFLVFSPRLHSLTPFSLFAYALLAPLLALVPVLALAS